MIVILLLIPVSLVLAAGFLGAFFWAVRSGQFEDTCTPSMRILAEDERPAAVEPGESVSQTAHEDRNV